MTFDEWKAEAMRLVDEYAGDVDELSYMEDQGTPKQIAEDYPDLVAAVQNSRAALSAHLDLMRPEPAKQLECKYNRATGIYEFEQQRGAKP